MFKGFKKFFGFQDDEPDAADSKHGFSKKDTAVLDHAKRALAEDAGESPVHSLIVSTRQALGGALGRAQLSKKVVELAENLKGNSVELFVTYYHELMHHLGIMDEGAVEWLAQKAARERGYRGASIAYAPQVKSFERVVELVTGTVDTTRAQTRNLIQELLKGPEHLKARVAQGLQREKAIPPAAAHREAARILKRVA